MAKKKVSVPRKKKSPVVETVETVQTPEVYTGPARRILSSDTITNFRRNF